MPEQHRLQALASQPYVHALGALTRREEVLLHCSQLNNGDDDWSYAIEVAVILDTFQNFLAASDGSLACLRELAQIERGLVSQLPKLTDHLGDLCVVASNVLSYGFRRSHGHGQQVADKYTNISRSYGFFKAMSAMLLSLIHI